LIAINGLTKFAGKKGEKIKTYYYIYYVHCTIQIIERKLKREMKEA
jgi:hypothetical protein